MKLFNAFLAGFIATLLCHQGVLSLLHSLNPEVPAAYNLSPVPPFGAPAVISLAFWGGVWGIVLWQLIKNSSGMKYWLLALVIGAVGPSAVALFIVMPLKGLGVAMGWNPQIIMGALILNAAWGLGTGFFIKLLPDNSPKAPDEA
ncbi:MAG: hypothetical protein R3352_02165 [Salinisphaeraceae bacterium]|nr:hypothetical protein [Salinisphaeraceae bacterium]